MTIQKIAEEYGVHYQTACRAYRKAMAHLKKPGRGSEVGIEVQADVESLMRQDIERLLIMALISSSCSTLITSIHRG